MDERSAEHVQRFEFDTYALDVTWDRPNPDDPALPALVGPFASRESAHAWATLNVPTGSWEVRPLAWPYWVSPEVAYQRGVQAALAAVESVRTPPGKPSSGGVE